MLAILVDEDIPRLNEFCLAIFPDERRCRSGREGRDAAWIGRKRREDNVVERVLDLILDLVFYLFGYLELLSYPLVQGLARARADKSDTFKSVPCLEALESPAGQ